MVNFPIVFRSIKEVITRTSGRGASSALTKYQQHYFQAGRGKPVVQVMLTLGVIGYVIDYYGHLMTTLTSAKTPVAGGVLPVDVTVPTTQFYRRPLPATCIAFSSDTGRQLFREALAAGGMEAYFPLAEQFCTQDEPAYCGLATLSMILNALSVDPGRIWKGVWRWYSETLLDCCEPLEQVKVSGINFSTFLCLAKCNGLDVESHYADQSSIEMFRSLVEQTSREGRAEQFVAVSYSRRVLGQTGDGHFSPIGGYHKEKDLVLVLDVARFKYAPHWVPLPLMFEAMRGVDGLTNRSRGFASLRRSRIHTSILFAVSKAKLGQCSWERAAKQLQNVLLGIVDKSTTAEMQMMARHASQPMSHASCQSRLTEGAREVIKDFLRALAGQLGVVLCDNSSCHGKPSPVQVPCHAPPPPPDSLSERLSGEHWELIEELRRQIEATELFEIAHELHLNEQHNLLVSQVCGLGPEHGVVVLALALSSMLSSGNNAAVEYLLQWMRNTDALPNILGNEVRMIRMQLEELQGRRVIPPLPSLPQ